MSMAIAPATVASTVAQHPSTATASSASAQQRTALNRMLATYTRDQQHGADQATLSSLGKQIMAAAKTLGQHVSLPQAPANADQSSSTQTTTASGKVNVTA
jgi:hypothetical protein